MSDDAWDILERKFRELGIEFCVAIASRAALRDLFFVFHLTALRDTTNEYAFDIRHALLEDLRANLVSVICSQFPGKEEKVAAQQAAAPLVRGYLAKKISRCAISAAASTAQKRRVSVARFAARSVKFSRTEKAAFIAVEDSNSSPEDVWRIPLWSSGSAPPDVKANWDDFSALSQQVSYWSFWKTWFDGFLRGQPLDWELQRRVALIDNHIWEAGPEAVATEIERIKAAYLAEKAPQAERVEFNAETAKFYTVPLSVAKPDFLGATLTQVQDALDDVLANPSNGLHDNAREVRVLRRVFTKYGNDPQQIEMGFVSVHKGLTRQILNDELPASEENLAFQDALEEGARGIRATHPDVAENRQILTDQTIRELPEGAKEKLEDALPMLVAISDNNLADDWQNDIPQLLNDATQPLPSGAPPLPGADETTRIFSRAAKIALHLKIADTVHKIDGSAGYKAARIVTTIAALVTLGLAIL
ncbi:hypothetical protein [Roseovarius atlanticus]|uniref:hypothetical protein n=1 Tax=Roseovarius atlanticus TaxID=1641875 RepID=UPI001C9451B6|nr:hypothetical protein [Roseovarius atlanticus]MBY5987630.1 hypothetical protein [Roseovarius atlanticus]MBY6123021.1 hypothetical protein [Roseovarius atlanticus]MBY6147517.1 hypothetical protein [Roseovarius atlanticus]